MPIVAILLLAALAAGALVASGTGAKLGERLADRSIRRRREGKQGSTEHERLALLTPDTQEFARRLIGTLAAKGIRTILGETYRTPERQREIFEEGTRTSLSEPGWHTFGRAFHLIVIDPKTGEPDVKARRRDLYTEIHRLARELGGTVYGYKTLRNPKTGATFTDPAHVEYRAGLSLASLRRQAGYA